MPDDRYEALRKDVIDALPDEPDAVEDIRQLDLDDPQMKFKLIRLAWAQRGVQLTTLDEEISLKVTHNSTTGNIRVRRGPEGRQPTRNELSDEFLDGLMEQLLGEPRPVDN